VSLTRGVGGWVGEGPHAFEIQHTHASHQSIIVNTGERRERVGEPVKWQ